MRRLVVRAFPQIPLFFRLQKRPYSPESPARVLVADSADDFLENLTGVLRRRDWWRRPYLRRWAPSLTPFHVSNLLDRPLPPDTALAFFRWIARWGHYHHSPQCHAALLKTLLRSQSPSVEAITEVANSMVESCASADDLLYTVDSLKNIDSGFIGIGCYKFLLTRLANLGMIDAMKSVFDEISIENTFRFNLMVYGCCKMGDLDEAKRYWGLMLEAELKPEVFSCNALLLGCCRSGDLDGARKTFDEMAVMGLTGDSSSYNILVRGLCRAGRVDDAVELMKKMVDDGFAPDEHIFESVVKTICRPWKEEDEGFEDVRLQSEHGSLFSDTKDCEQLGLQDRSDEIVGVRSGHVVVGSLPAQASCFMAF